MTEHTCKDCGKPTEGSCTSLIDGHKWYKCKDCFDKEQSDGFKFIGISIVLMFITMAVVAYFSSK